ncbi:hypothetical protein MtrunA17_Chr2g0295341 [Medicago truncatula]|uniref:Uncharacterized protein n=1 Tax=Medicago truncatula TaxID=3880 RepID=A0A396J858_MEDTR|nr:hypothetical protein MtrunA17_Chr2g0295341 [Medicago truncatula]
MPSGLRLKCAKILDKNAPGIFSAKKIIKKDWKMKVRTEMKLKTVWTKNAILGPQLRDQNAIKNKIE